jgi:hypothetical protein
MTIIARQNVRAAQKYPNSPQRNPPDLKHFARTRAWMKDDDDSFRVK